MRSATLLKVCALILLGGNTLQGQTVDGKPVNPVILMVILGAISLAPFLSIMTTSFVKISIVLSLIRSAIGTQVPSGQVTNGLALVLTFFIMSPVAQRMYEASEVRNTGGVFAIENLTVLYDAAEKGKEPLRDFLLRHARIQDRALFVSLRARLNPETPVPRAVPVAPEASTEAPSGNNARRVLRRDEEFGVLLPAFVTSELKSAFEAGFLVLLPFLVIDVVVANVLVALGLSMIQPATVSLPLKLLLFVVADGWYLIVRGLVLSYA